MSNKSAIDKSFIAKLPQSTKLSTSTPPSSNHVTKLPPISEGNYDQNNAQSWLQAGWNALEKSLDNKWKQELSRFLTGWGRDALTDPTVQLYALSNFHKAMPVRLPNHRNETLYGVLNGKLNTWLNEDQPGVTNEDYYQGDSGVPMPKSGDKLQAETPEFELSDEFKGEEVEPNEPKLATGGSTSATSRLKNLPRSGEKPSQHSKTIKLPASSTEATKPGLKYVNPRYDWVFNDPYGTKTRKTRLTPDQLMEDLISMGYGIGYKFIQGYEIGTMANWNVQIYPYDQEHGNPRTGCLTPELPEYKLPIPINNTQTFSFSKYLPCIRWNIDIGNLKTNSIPLFNGSSMDVPNGMNYNVSLSLTVVDDLKHSMEKYVRKYINAIYDPVNRKMAPYWASAFYIPITIFDRSYNIDYRFDLITVLRSWNAELASDENESESSISLEMSVIGMCQYTNGNSQVTEGKYLNGTGFTWNQINITPKGI
jgi:hypothetical protein